MSAIPSAADGRIRVLELRSVRGTGTALGTSTPCQLTGKSRLPAVSNAKRSSPVRSMLHGGDSLKQSAR